MEPLISEEQRRWAQGAIARIAGKVRRVGSHSRRRALLVHLDGVPRSLLEQAIARGQMPFLARLLRSGVYRLDPAFWGSPASTPCFQAGLLYGARHPNLPAYLWNDRTLGRLVRMNVPADAAVMERRFGRDDGQWLLSGGGTAYLSLFSGGACNQLSMARLANKRRAVKSVAHDLIGLTGAARRSALEYVSHVISSTAHNSAEIARWIFRQADARHEPTYWLNRLVLLVAWDLARKRALIDMVRGVPLIYLVFGNYDEVSHRRGPRSEESSAELFRADAELAELFAVARTLDEPYDVIFLTDHGHVDCLPFERRSGTPFSRLLADGPPERLPDEAVRALLDGREALPEEERRDAPVVVDAGNFAHVYFDRSGPPLEARELLARHPGALSRCARHPDVGICALRRGDSAVALIRGGVYRADELHRAPLADGFSRAALADLLGELPTMNDAGDLVLYGDALREGGTVGFAWEFGSHGGLTRIETESLVMWPVSGPAQLDGLTHSVQLHGRLAGAYRS